MLPDGARGQGFFFTPFERADDQANFADLRIVGEHVDEFLAVRREAYVRIDVCDELFWSTTEYWSTVQVLERAAADFRTNEIQVIAVRRKAQALVTHKCRSDDLGVAAGGNVAQPQALMAVVVDDVEDIFAVWGDGNERGFSGLGYLADGKVLERSRLGAREEGVDAVGSRGDQKNRDQAGDA